MKTLVIKSASMEQLASLAAALEIGADPSRDVHILAHRHFAPAIRAAFPAATVVEYPSDADFGSAAVDRMVSAGRLAQRYDRVVALAGNLRGGGLSNVVAVGHRFNDTVEIFNVNGEFIPVSKGAARRQTVFRIVLSPAVFFATIVAFAAGGIVLAACALLAPFAGGDNKGG